MKLQLKLKSLLGRILWGHIFTRIMSLIYLWDCMGIAAFYALACYNLSDFENLWADGSFHFILRKFCQHKFEKRRGIKQKKTCVGTIWALSFCCSCKLLIFAYVVWWRWGPTLQDIFKFSSRFFFWGGGSMTHWHGFSRGLVRWFVRRRPPTADHDQYGPIGSREKFALWITNRLARSARAVLCSRCARPNTRYAGTDSPKRNNKRDRSHDRLLVNHGMMTPHWKHFCPNRNNHNKNCSLFSTLKLSVAGNKLNLVHMAVFLCGREK